MVKLSNNLATNPSTPFDAKLVYGLLVNIILF